MRLIEAAHRVQPELLSDSSHISSCSGWDGCANVYPHLCVRSRYQR